MIASLFLAGPTSSEPPKHLPHALIAVLKYAHGIPVIAGLLIIVFLVCYAFFKLAHMHPA